MKKLVNQPESVVEEMVQGLVAAFGGLRRLPGLTVLVRSNFPDWAERPVAVISGGGSGHEPAHAGYVGQGMLSGAVLGAVFTSPSPDSVLAAIRATAGPRGALLVVKNYTGDRLNFGLAAELARAEGIPVETAFVADDVALAGATGRTGKRGLAGTILVHKVAGAVAEAGGSLAEVAAAARATASAVRTMGVALSPCTVPAAGRPTFTLGDNEIELGLGIHGEPGVQRGPLEPADALVDHMLDKILAMPTPFSVDRVVLLVNNLGGTPTMELAIVARRAIAVLENKRFAVERVYVGTFLSALEMAGISLSVLPVDDERLRLLDAPTDAPAWPNAAARPRARAVAPEAAPPPLAVPAIPAPPQTELGKALGSALQQATAAIIAEAEHLTQLDQVVGDGDMGISLERGARAVQAALASYPLDDPGATLHALSVTLQRALGGTSGPLYAAFFLRAAVALRRGSPTDLRNWATAFQDGCDGLAELGGTMRGDRTMLDALLHAAEAFQKAANAGQAASASLRAAAAAAATAAKATASMLPQLGRSSYLGERALGNIDPGAEAVAVWLGALSANW